MQVRKYYTYSSIPIVLGLLLVVLFNLLQCLNQDYPYQSKKQWSIWPISDGCFQVNWTEHSDKNHVDLHTVHYNKRLNRFGSP